MTRPRRALPAAAAIALALCGTVLAGCGTDAEGGEPPVTATTGILADITQRVAGPEAKVEQLIPDGTSPHELQLSARDRQAVEDSTLLVYNGGGLEANLPIGDFDVATFALIDNVGALRPFGGGEAGAGEGEEDGADPHVWMDPTMTAAALPALADALAAADPGHAAGYRRRARALARQLRDLDAELRRTLAAIPAANRELVTSHDALGYFADRYGFDVAATPFPASGPEAEPSADAIRDVTDAVRETGVPTVFAQADDDPEVLRRIASAAQVRVVDGLRVEAPGPRGYLEMLRRDAALIRDGLGSGEG